MSTVQCIMVPNGRLSSLQRTMYSCNCSTAAASKPGVLHNALQRQVLDVTLFTQRATQGRYIS